MSGSLFPEDDAPRVFTREEKLRAINRELAMRERVYPQWVRAGRMTGPVATREIAIMRQIAADYAEPQA